VRKCGRRAYCYLSTYMLGWNLTPSSPLTPSTSLLSAFLLAPPPQGEALYPIHSIALWWMCSVRNGPSRGPRRRFWVKQHPISNPSIPSQAGSLFTGAGKHRNPFPVSGVSQMQHSKKKNLDSSSFEERWEAEPGTNMHCCMRSFWSLSSAHANANIISINPPSNYRTVVSIGYCSVYTIRCRYFILLYQPW